MAVENDTPVAEILGIGPTYASRFKRAGIFTVFDLLWASRTTLQDVANSADKAREWRTAASFLQVAGITPHIAEALIEAGIDRLDELSTRKVSQVLQAIADVDMGGLTDEEIVDAAGSIIAEAMRIRHSSILHVEVQNGKGRAVVGAEVRVGSLSVTTDKRGRARIVGIQSGIEPRVLIEHPAGTVRLIEGLNPVADPDVNALTRVRLPRFRRVVDLSEFEGDVLPPRTGEPRKEETKDFDALREGDLLRYIALRRSGMAILVSLFKDYRKGAFVAVQYRVPKDSLPDDVDLFDYMTWDGVEFRKWRMTPTRVDRYRRAHRFRHLLPDRSASPQERVDALVAWSRALIKAGVFSRGGRQQ